MSMRRNYIHTINETYLNTKYKKISKVKIKGKRTIYEVNTTDTYSDVEILVLETLDLQLNHYVIKIIFVSIQESLYYNIRRK